MEDGKIYVQRSYDEGINWDNSISITFYSNYICSNVDFFELVNHDIISSYRAIVNNPLKIQKLNIIEKYVAQFHMMEEKLGKILK